MKLLLVGLNFAPELTGIGRYTGELAAWLAGRGHELRVITAPPYYPAWRVGEGYSPWRYHREVWQGVDVWRCPLWVPGQPSGIKRVIHLASFAMGSLPPALVWAGWRPDWVFSVAPAFLSLPVALLATRLGGARCWLHVQDFEIDAALGLGILDPGLLGRWVLKAESFLLRRCAVVSTISRSMQARLITKGVAQECTFLLPNWADPCLDFDPEAGRRFRARLGIGEEPPLALYSGNLGKKQGLEILPQMASSLPQVYFLVCGEGAVRAELERTCGGFANVRFLPLQPEGELAGMLSAADVHLVLQRRGAADLVLPSKLTNILAVGGRAVVTSDPDTELGRVVQENSGLAVLSPPEDPGALAKAILLAVQQGRAEGRCNEVARRHACLHLSRGTILERFEERLLEGQIGDK